MKPIDSAMVETKVNLDWIVWEKLSLNPGSDTGVHMTFCKMGQSRGLLRLWRKCCFLIQAIGISMKRKMENYFVIIKSK